jgi:hypothetical protein
MENIAQLPTEEEEVEEGNEVNGVSNQSPVQPQQTQQAQDTQDTQQAQQPQQPQEAQQLQQPQETQQAQEAHKETIDAEANEEERNNTSGTNDTNDRDNAAVQVTEDSDDSEDPSPFSSPEPSGSPTASKSIAGGNQAAPIMQPNPHPQPAETARDDTKAASEAASDNAPKATVSAQHAGPRATGRRSSALNTPVAGIPEETRVGRRRTMGGSRQSLSLPQRRSRSPSPSQPPTPPLLRLNPGTLHRDVGALEDAARVAAEEAQRRTATGAGAGSEKLAVEEVGRLLGAMEAALRHRRLDLVGAFTALLARCAWLSLDAMEAQAAAAKDGMASRGQRGGARAGPAKGRQAARRGGLPLASGQMPPGRESVQDVYLELTQREAAALANDTDGISPLAPPAENGSSATLSFLEASVPPPATSAKRVKLLQVRYYVAQRMLALARLDQVHPQPAPLASSSRPAPPDSPRSALLSSPQASGLSRAARESQLAALLRGAQLVSQLHACETRARLAFNLTSLLWRLMRPVAFSEADSLAFEPILHELLLALAPPVLQGSEAIAWWCQTTLTLAFLGARAGQEAAANALVAAVALATEKYAPEALPACRRQAMRANLPAAPLFKGRVRQSAAFTSAAAAQLAEAEAFVTGALSGAASPTPAQAITRALQMLMALPGVANEDVMLLPSWEDNQDKWLRQDALMVLVDLAQAALHLKDMTTAARVAKHVSHATDGGAAAPRARVLLSQLELQAQDVIYTPTAVQQRLAILDRLLSALSMLMEAGVPAAAQEACACIWSACLPLLQPKLRHLARRPLRLVSEALTTIGSHLTMLRCMLHIELAKIALDADLLVAAAEEVSAAHAVDADGLYEHEIAEVQAQLNARTTRPDVGLQEPSDAEIIARRLQQAKAATDAASARSWVVQAAAVLAPGVFGQSVPETPPNLGISLAEAAAMGRSDHGRLHGGASDNNWASRITSLPRSSVASEAASSSSADSIRPRRSSELNAALDTLRLHVQRCEDVAREIDTLPRPDGDQRDYFFHWVDLCKASRNLQLWDVAQACAHCGLRAAGWVEKDMDETTVEAVGADGLTIRRRKVKRRRADTRAGRFQHLDHTFHQERASLHFVLGECIAKDLQTRGGDIYLLPVVPLDKALSAWYLAQSATALNHFAQGGAIGIESETFWLVRNSCAYFWNYLRPTLTAPGFEAELLPHLNRMQELLGHAGRAFSVFPEMRDVIHFLTLRFASVELLMALRAAQAHEGDAEALKRLDATFKQAEAATRNAAVLLATAKGKPMYGDMDRMAQALAGTAVLLQKTVDAATFQDEHIAALMTIRRLDSPGTVPPTIKGGTATLAVPDVATLERAASLLERCVLTPGNQRASTFPRELRVELWTRLAVHACKVECADVARPAASLVVAVVAKQAARKALTGKGASAAVPAMLCHAAQAYLVLATLDAQQVPARLPPAAVRAQLLTLTMKQGLAHAAAACGRACEAGSVSTLIVTLKALWNAAAAFSHYEEDRLMMLPTLVGCLERLVNISFPHWDEEREELDGVLLPLCELAMLAYSDGESWQAALCFADKGLKLISKERNRPLWIHRLVCKVKMDLDISREMYRLESEEPLQRASVWLAFARLEKPGAKQQRCLEQAAASLEQDETALDRLGECLAELVVAKHNAGGTLGEVYETSQRLFRALARADALAVASLEESALAEAEGGKEPREGGKAVKPRKSKEPMSQTVQERAEAGVARFRREVLRLQAYMALAMASHEDPCCFVNSVLAASAAADGAWGVVVDIAGGNSPFAPAPDARLGADVSVDRPASGAEAAASPGAGRRKATSLARPVSSAASKREASSSPHARKSAKGGKKGHAALAAVAVVVEPPTPSRRVSLAALSVLPTRAADWLTFNAQHVTSSLSESDRASLLERLLASVTNPVHVSYFCARVVQAACDTGCHASLGPLVQLWLWLARGTFVIRWMGVFFSARSLLSPFISSPVPDSSSRCQVRSQ